MDNQPPVYLPDIAEQINKCHRTTIEEAHRAGTLLQTVKDYLPHGEFEAWCEKNIAISRTQRKRYMQLAKRPVRAISDKTITEALAKPKAPPKPKVVFTIEGGAQLLGAAWLGDHEPSVPAPRPQMSVGEARNALIGVIAQDSEYLREVIRTLRQRHHPDKGGNAHTAQLLNQIAEALLR